ncbi:MAG: glycosyltransferase [Gammaproteobacteria bacterium]|nr:glycosyltransferase [Gammaproteobacteria bacterium]
MAGPEHRFDAQGLDAHGSDVQGFDANLTVSLTRYGESDELVQQTLGSLASQRGVRLLVLFLDQRPNASMAEHCRRLCNLNVRFDYRGIEARSLSYARNLAIAESPTRVLLYIDSDAIAEPDWAVQLYQAIVQTGAAVAGCRIVPRWHRKPLWLTRARVVYEQYSMLDFGVQRSVASKVVGAGFGIDIQRLGDLACFDEKLGRRDGILLGGEETDLCDRARARGEQVVYEGAALLHHQVLPERIRYVWIARRLYYAGISRALRGGRPSPSHRMSIWDYLCMPLVLLPYTLGYRRGLRMRRSAPSA